MPRLILHIGMEKTGTSAIQRFLARHRTALRLMGVQYPRAADATGAPSDSHIDLAAAIGADLAGQGPHPVFGSAGTVIEGYATKADVASTTILSSEGLSAPDPGFAAALAPLAGRFDVSVVVYLRRQDEWALSAYRQCVMDPDIAETRPLDVWLDDPATRRRLDYNTMLGWWEAAFGADAVQVLRYPHDLPLIAGFLNHTGMPAAARLLREPDGRVNESAADAIFLETLVRNGGTAAGVPDLDQDARDALLLDLRPSNNEVRQRYLPDLSGLFALS